jgi:hypothetical protein
MIALVSTSSSGLPRGILRCVDRYRPRTRQARRSETPSTEVT